MRVQQRKGDGRAHHAAQKCAAGQVFLGDDTMVPASSCQQQLRNNPEIPDTGSEACATQFSGFARCLQPGCPGARRPPHLERRALHDSFDNRRKTISIARGIAHDGAHRRHVVVFDSAAERVSQQLFGQRADEDIRAAQDRLRRSAGPFTLEPSPRTPEASMEAPVFAERRARRPPRRSSPARSQAGPASCGSRRRRDWRDALPSLAHAKALPPAVVLLQRRDIGGRRVAAACPARSRESTCRAAPERCASRATSPSECCPARAAPAAHRSASVTRRNWLP